MWGGTVSREAIGSARVAQRATTTVLCAPWRSLGSVSATARVMAAGAVPSSGSKPSMRNHAPMQAHARRAPGQQDGPGGVEAGESQEPPRFQSMPVGEVMRIAEHTSVLSAAGAIETKLRSHAKVGGVCVPCTGAAAMRARIYRRQRELGEAARTHARSHAHGRLHRATQVLVFAKGARAVHTAVKAVATARRMALTGSGCDIAMQPVRFPDAVTMKEKTAMRLYLYRVPLTAARAAAAAEAVEADASPHQVRTPPPAHGLTRQVLHIELRVCKALCPWTQVARCPPQPPAAPTQVLRVGNATEPRPLAGAIAGMLAQHGGVCEAAAAGAVAVFRAVHAVAIARHVSLASTGPQVRTAAGQGIPHPRSLPSHPLPPTSPPAGTAEAAARPVRAAAVDGHPGRG
jgi:stage V sporulation protein SpoVS